LRALAARPELADRVDLRLRFVDTDEKRRLLEGACGVVYLPVDEDSFGYVTAEAMSAGRPVVTARDSGGVLNLVRHESTGLVCNPEPGALGAAYDEVYGSPARSERWGRAAAAAVASLGLSWDHVIAELLG
jgi:glycosyltransferase involved in cell wall biosynthesis